MTKPDKRRRTARCPQCCNAVELTADNRFRPFCSERCKLIDLGAWATESYRVPTDEDPAAAGDPDPNPGQ